MYRFGVPPPPSGHRAVPYPQGLLAAAQGEHSTFTSEDI